MKKLSSIMICLLVLMMWLTQAGYALDDDLIEQKENGFINWSKGFIISKGIGAPPEKYYDKPAARPMAIRAAKIVALRNILEIVNSVRIDSTTVVKDFAIKKDVIMSKVEGMVRGAEVVKTEYMTDGTVEVTMKMNLNGGFAQLVLPDDVKPIEPLTPVSQSKTDPPPAPLTKSGFTGLVVDSRGLNAHPAMAPKILDEDGQEVYGSAFVSREFAVQQGMSGYAKNIKAAGQNPRVTDKPLTVKGLRTQGPGRSNIVISRADAAKLRNSAEHLSFLRKCRVMIVVD